MSVRSSRVLRSALCLVLAVLMALGTCVTAFAAESDKPSYVSLGDSMTNGLGLNTGYDDNGCNGYLEVATNGYPNLVAEEYGWDLTQLATSAMRAEDLHYILEVGEPDAYQGDIWTKKDLLEDENRWGNSAVKDTVAETFQNSVRDADVISVAVGNANFGVYLMDMLSAAVGMDDGWHDYSYATIDAVLADLDAETKAFVVGIYDELMSYLGAYFPEELARTLADRMGYVVASYVEHYNGALDRIVELNPDVDIIIVGLMNTMSGYDMYITYQGAELYLNMADVLDIILNPMNLYLAGMAATKQAIGMYDQADIYYAEVDRIKTLATTFKDEYKSAPKFYLERFVPDITGFVFPLMGLKSGVIDYLDVYEFKYEYGADSTTYVTAKSGSIGYEAATTKAAAATAYLVVEEAILNAMDKTPSINLDEITLPEGEFNVKTLLGSLLGDKLSAEEFTVEAMEKVLAEDGLIVALLSLYGRMKLASGMSAHPSADAHYALYKEIVATYGEHTAADEVVATTTEALTQLVALLKEYGPEYADDAWNYAVEQGYVAAAQAAIDEMLLAAEAELDAFMADPEGYVAAASAELQVQLAALKTALAESENALADDLLAQIETMEAQLADLYAQLETATGEVKVQLEAAIAEIETAISALEAEAAALENDIAAITAEIEAIEADIAALGEKVAAVGEELTSLVDQAVAMKESLETLVAEGPEALEENIDAVVTQIETAVDTIVTIAGEVEETVAAAEELGASIDSAINTAVAAIDARINGFAATVEGIAGTMSAGIAPIVEALNDMAEAVAEEAAAAVAEYEAEIAAVMAAAEEAAAAIRAEYAEEIAALEEAVAAKKAELETKLDELEAKKAELEGAAEDVKADIEAAIADIEAAVADIEAAIAEAETALAEKVAEVETAVGEIIAAAETKAAELQDQIDELLAEAGEQIDAAVKEAAAALAKELEGVNEELKDAFEDLAAAGIAAAEEFAAEAAEQAVAAAEALVALVEEKLNTLAETIWSYVEGFAAEIEQAYQNATTGEYEINSANYYVSLGDDSAVSQSFVDELAAELGVDYKNLAAAGSTPEDLLAALAAGDEAYIAEIAKADLITVSYNPATFATTQVEKLTGNQTLEEMDWTAYVGEEGAVYVDEALAELEAYLAEAGITGSYANIVSTVVESYAYSVMSFAVNYAVMVDAIHEISPNAEVIILGSYNAFNDAEFVMGADVLPLGEGMEALTELANAYLLAYAAIAENTTYVDVTGTDTVLELSGRIEIDVTDPFALIEVFNMLQNLGDTVTPTADGHTYIKNQILGVETIIEPTGLKGDVNLDGEVNPGDVNLLYRYVMKRVTLNSQQLANADVNGDGVADAGDLNVLYRYAMNYITTL